MEYLKHLLTEIGLEPERVRMFNLSAAMAGAFVEAVQDITEQVTKLGPSLLRRTAPSQPEQNQENAT